MGLSSDNVEIHSTLVNLQKNMLPASYHNIPLADVIEAPGLETHLSGRRPTINAAMGLPGHTLKSVEASLLKENAALAAGAPGGVTAALGAGSAAVDKDGHATTLAPFKALEANMAGYNLLTEAGRRNALTAGLAAGNLVIVTRVIFREYSIDKSDRGADRMASRNATLGAFSGLRPHLHEYLNWYMRVDITTGLVDPLLLKYEFASLTDRRLLDRFTALALDEMDLVAAPGGLLGFNHRRDALAKPLHVDARDYYCTVSLIAELSAFAGKLLKSVGLPTGLPAGASGYTFSTFCEFYSGKLQLAKRLPLLQDQYEHLAACDEQFRAALVCMRITLQAVLGHSDVGSQTLTIAILADDADPVRRLKQLDADITRKVQARSDLGALLPAAGSTAPAVDFNNLRLSDSAWTKQKAAAKKRKVGDAEIDADDPRGASSHVPVGDGLIKAPPEDDPLDKPNAGAGDNPLPPCILSNSWKWLDNGKTALVISGRVWNVKEIAKHLGLPLTGDKAPCWPYYLAMCEKKNRPARCGRWGAKGHGAAAGHPDSLLAKIDAAALASAYSRPASDSEKHGISTKLDWSKVPDGGKGRGRGRGRDGRGRGRQGQGDQHFGRPLHP